MSYSFQFTAATKEEAKQRTAEKFDEVIVFQPSHEKDKIAALANANAMIDLLGDVPDNQKFPCRARVRSDGSTTRMHRMASARSPGRMSHAQPASLCGPRKPEYPVSGKCLGPRQ